MDESATEEEAFYLEQVTLEDDEDDEFDYTEVVVEDDEDEGFGEDAAEDEDLEQALKTLKTREDGLPLVQVEAVPRSAITRRPEVLDDFIRNVLLKMGMVSAAGSAGSDDQVSPICVLACVLRRTRHSICSSASGIGCRERESSRRWTWARSPTSTFATSSSVREAAQLARRLGLHASHPAPPHPIPTGPHHATPTPTAVRTAAFSWRSLIRCAAVRSRPAEEHAGLHRPNEADL